MDEFQSQCPEIDSNHLLERLAQSLAERLTPTLPLSVQLWNARAIAIYLQRSPAVVLERVVTLPGFPTPIRLPSMRAAPRSGGPSQGERALGQPLWKAVEVIAWVDLHREKRVGRPRGQG